MIQPKKRMVFHFYINSGWENSITNKIHLKCLELYGYIFDEIVFVINIDDVNDIETIKKFQLKMLDLGLTPRMSFKVVENHYLRDSKTFYDEVVLNMDKYDGLTFFGHNKGLTNINIMDKEVVSRWITSMYYFSLEYINEVIYLLTDGREMSYGPLLVNIDDKYLPQTLDNGDDKSVFLERSNVVLGKNKYFYMGTFFWLNTMVLNDYISRNNIELPKLCDRWYAENFCANVFPMGFAYSHNGIYVTNYINGGEDIDVLIRKITTEEEYNAYSEFNNYVINNVEW